MKHNLETANIIALEALDEQLDRYAASVPLGARLEADNGEKDEPEQAAEIAGGR